MPTRFNLPPGQLFMENENGEYIPLLNGITTDVSPLWIEHENEEEYIIPDIIAKSFTVSAMCIHAKALKYAIYGCATKRLMRQAIRREKRIRKAEKKKGLYFSKEYRTELACHFVLENAKKYRH